MFSFIFLIFKLIQVTVSTHQLTDNLSINLSLFSILLLVEMIYIYIYCFIYIQCCPCNLI